MYMLLMLIEHAYMQVYLYWRTPPVVDDNDDDDDKTVIIIDMCDVCAFNERIYCYYSNSSAVLWAFWITCINVGGVEIPREESKKLSTRETVRAMKVFLRSV